MKGTHWGKATIGLQAAVPKRPHTFNIKKVNGRHSLTELRVICVLAREWGKLIRRSRGLIPIRRNRLWKVENL